MKKVFVDCGFHHGEGLAQFERKLGINNEWIVHCFEPNPECFMQRRLLNRYDFVLGGRLTLINIVSHVKAVWIYDGEVSFSQENHYSSESGSPTDGTSIIDGWRSRITDLKNCMDYGGGGFQLSINVECIDFSKFIQQFKDHEVYCKMDIEGAEYSVLRKILRDGNANIFKHLWIEFHDRDVPGETPLTTKQLITELSKFTTVELWE